MTPPPGPVTDTLSSSSMTSKLRDLGDRRDVLLQEIASYLLLQNDLVKHQFETTGSTPTKVNGPSKMGSL